MNSKDDEITLYPHERWMRSGACLGLDSNLFFPEKKGDNLYAEGKLVCDVCPVREKCLDYAYRYNIKQGMWGGKTPRQRVSGRKRWLLNRRDLGDKIPNHDDSRGR